MDAEFGAETPVADEASISTDQAITDSPDVAPESTEASQEPDAPTYTIKVDGEEVPVTLDELLNGYQRQADYTRKTQELAEQRKSLAQMEGLLAALEADPERSIRALAEAYGITSDNPEAEPLDPEEARIAQLERFVAEQQERERQAALDRELEGLHSKYGDFADEELFAHAIKRGIPNLEAAYRDMTYERATAEVKAAAEKQRATEEEARVEAKRKAAVVEGGAPRAAGTVVQGGTTSGRLSIAEAWSLAKQSFGS